MRIVGANHNPTARPRQPLSALFLRRGQRRTQTLYRRYMAGWFEYHLRGDASYGPWVFKPARWSAGVRPLV